MKLSRACVVLVAFALLLLCSHSLASHDPNSTATVFVHGFNPDGYQAEGIFGEDDWDEGMDPFTGIAGLPNISEPGAAYLSNVVTSTRYYGDTPPFYYTAEDIAELDAVTAQWGGGVPRYALIVAKYARFVMERSGAQQVNLFSGSYGSFVTRWIIEKDVESLASEGKIARWLSAEGVLNGHWAASNDVMLSLWDLFGTPSLDVDQMHYDWVEANLHSPRWQADNLLFGEILIGMMGTTDDSANDGQMTNAMLLVGDYQPNDGVVGLYDSYFHAVTPQSRFEGRSPARGYSFRNHYELASYPAAWAQVANFLTGRKRVTVTMTRTQVNDIHEPDDWYWDFTPAEIIFESEVFSPAALARWGVTDRICIRDFGGANTPIYEWGHDGLTQTLDHMLFDDFVLDEEVELNLHLWAREIDWDERYDVLEVIGVEDPTDEMGEGWTTVPVTGPGTYYFEASDWNCDIAVEVFDYPFETLTSVNGGGIPTSLGNRLALFPNPFSSTLEIQIPRLGGESQSTDPAVLEIYDVGGRLVRRLHGNAEAGFNWDGRNGSGHQLPTGVYLHRLLNSGQTFTGKSLLLR